MKKTKLILLGASITLMIAMLCAKSYGQTQMAMNQEASKNYVKADKELNDIYKEVLKAYASDAKFIQNLKIAQRLWVQLRDAELAVKFPESGSYGSVETMCKLKYLEGLTKQRSKFLKAWLIGAIEGDACNGSVKYLN